MKTKIGGMPELPERAKQSSAAINLVCAEELGFLEAAAAVEAGGARTICVKIPLGSEKSSHGCGNLKEVFAVKPSYESESHDGFWVTDFRDPSELKLINRRLGLGRLRKRIRHGLKDVANHRFALVQMGA
ncbi:MAG TPA: hypothetical protein VM735_08250 [Candidatus Kapabacteria bacterium]|nr:hypothetical protein [Candidatus Kapabacteria bacterium]